MKIVVTTVVVCFCLFGFWVFHSRNDEAHRPTLKSSTSVTISDLSEEFICWEYQLKTGHYVSVSQIASDGKGDKPLRHLFIDPNKISKAYLGIWLNKMSNYGQIFGLFIGVYHDDLDGTSQMPGTGLKIDLNINDALKTAQYTKVTVTRSESDGVEEMVIDMPDVLGGENTQFRLVTSKNKKAVMNRVKINPDYVFFSWRF